MAKFKPFADDSAALTIGDFHAENHADRVVLFGTLEITRDKAGLARARALAALLKDAVKALEAMGDALPDQVETPAPRTDTTENPFS